MCEKLTFCKDDFFTVHKMAALSHVQGILSLSGPDTRDSSGRDSTDGECSDRHRLPVQVLEFCLKRQGEDWVCMNQK